MKAFALILAAVILKLLEYGVRFAFAALLLLLVCVAILAGLARDQDFTRVVLQDVVPKLAPELEFGQNHGGLLAPEFLLESVSYTDPAGSQLQVGAIKLNWSPTEIWSRKLKVQLLDIASIELVVAPSQDAESSQLVQLPDIRLPISVDIKDLNIHRVRIVTAEDGIEQGPPIDLANIHLSTQAKNSSLQLSDIRATFRQQTLVTTATADISIETQGSWKINALLNGSASGIPLGLDSKLNYQLALSDSLENLAFTGQLDNANGGVHVDGSISPFDSSLPLTLHLVSDSFTIDSPEVAFNSSLDLRVVGNLSDGLEISGPAKIVASKPHIASYRIESLSALLSKENLSLKGLTLAVQLDERAEQRLEIVANSTLVAPYHATLQAHNSGQSNKLYADIAATWDGNAEHWPLVSLALNIPDVANWVPNAAGAIKLDAKLDVAASGQPSLVAKGYAKQMAWGEYRLESAELDTTVNLQRKGKASLQLVAAEANLAIKLDGLAEQNLEFVARSSLAAPYEATLQVRSTGPAGKLFADVVGSWDGDIEHLPQVSVALNIPDLSNWVPHAAGAIKLDGKLDTTVLGQPSVVAKGYAKQLAWREYRLASADLDANVSLQRNGNASLHLTAADADLGGQTVESVLIDLDGSTDNHHLTLSLDSPLAAVEARIGGGLKFNEAGDVKSWSGTISKLIVDNSQAGRLSLKSPAALAASQETFELRGACLQLETIDKATLCASGKLLANGQMSAAITQLELPLESLSVYVNGLNSRGTLTGRGAVGGNIKEPESITAELSLSIDEGGFSQARSGKTKEIQLFNFSKGMAWVSYHEQNLNLEFQLDEMSGGTMAARAQSKFGIDQFSEWQSIPISVTIDADSLPIDWLKQGLPDVRDLDGKLKVNLLVDGTLGAPVPKGEISATGDKLTIPLVGLNLSKWTVNVQPNGGDLTAALDLLADDGGTLNASLSGSWLKEGAIVGEVIGKSFPLYQTPDAQIWADPKLTLRYSANQLDVGGRVDVNKALIAPSISLKSSASKISISEDQVMVNEIGEAIDVGGGVALNADVTIAFGSDVRIKAYGLETKLGGKLLVIERPGRLTRARGEIRLVDGQYAAFGQPLKIKRGALLFQNTLLTQPALDVVAVREFDDVTVGVNARGTIDNPELELFSSPVLSQSDQLSWLVLGRPFDRKSSTKDSDNALAKATRALQLQGAEFLTGKLSRRLGIEDVALESTDDGSGSALVLGKYLSPRLYLSYGLGLFDARNQLKLKYQIGSDWAFEATSDGIDSGGDILYQREK
jgi:autotransporter translocation and assembly factor TamB